MSDKANEQFARLWTSAEPVVAGYVASLVRDFHAVQDILQDIAVVLLRKFDQYDSSKPFAAWAMGIARNEILARRRSESRHNLLLRDDLLEAFSASYEELAPELSSQTLALRHCLRKIGGRNLKVLRLRYDQALKPGQIAEQLGIAAGAVRVRLNRIRAALRNCVEKTLLTHQPRQA